VVALWFALSPDIGCAKRTAPLALQGIEASLDFTKRETTPSKNGVAKKTNHPTKSKLLAQVLIYADQT
jgi:hypothetical protein